MNISLNMKTVTNFLLVLLLLIKVSFSGGEHQIFELGEFQLGWRFTISFSVIRDSWEFE